MDLEKIALLIRDTSPSTDEGVDSLLDASLHASRYRCDLQRDLALKKAQYLYPQEKGKTELDRRVMLDASVADLERDYEFALRLEKIVDIKLGLAYLYEIETIDD